MLLPPDNHLLSLPASHPHPVPGMLGFQYLHLLPAGNLRIDLGCQDGRMPQHFLDIADVHILFQKQGGKGVPEHVGGYVQADSGLSGILFDHLAGRLLRITLSVAVQKKELLGLDLLPPVGAVLFHLMEYCSICDLDITLLGALSTDTQDSLLQIHPVWSQMAKLGDPQACGK